MSRMRVAARIARREAVRHPGRSALVVLLVGLPVLAMTVAVVLFRTAAPDPAEQWAAEFGAADLVEFVGDNWSVPADQAEGIELPGEDTGVQYAALPEGARAVLVRWVHDVALVSDGGRAHARVTDLPVGDPLTSGILHLVEGRAPGDGEVLISTSLAEALRLGVGDELAVPADGVPLPVAGIGERPSCLSCRVVVLGGGRSPGDLLDARWLVDSVRLIELPGGLGPEDLAPFTATGAVVPSPELVPWAQLPVVGTALADVEADLTRWAIVLGGVALTVAGIVISSAFAVGARRQLVTLGQLAANGAPGSVLRASLALQGTWAGLVGVLAGFAVALVALTAGRQRVETWLDRRLGTFDLRPRDLAIVALVGLTAATVAALVPARAAARTPTVRALAGRRPLPRVSHRVTVAGLVAVAVGLGLLFVAALGTLQGGAHVGQVWAYVALLGGVIELLGACAVAPALVARLEPLAARLRGSLRLAARSLARQRARTGAVVSAVAAAGALAVTASALIQGFESREGPARPGLPPDALLVAAVADDSPTGQAPPPADAVDAVRAVVPGVTALPVSTALTADGTAPHAVPAELADGVSEVYIGGFPSAVVVADPEIVDALDLRPSLRDALGRDGFVVAGIPPGTPGDRADVVLDPAGAARPGRALATDRGLDGMTVFLAPALVDDLGYETVPWGTLLHAPEPLSADQRADVQQLAWGGMPAAGAVLDEGITVVWGAAEPPGPSPYQLQLLLTGFALAFALFVVGAGLALVAADSRDERDVLTVAGAPPRRLARAAGAKAWLLAALGGVMAVPVGFLPVVVFARAYDGRFPLVFPSDTVAILLVITPLVAAIGALLASAGAQRLRPVRLSTSTFE